MLLIISLATLLNNLDTVKQLSSAVRVLYNPADTITVDQFLSLQAAKLKLDLIQLPDMQDERVSAGYLIGRLTTESSNVVLVTDSETLLNIGSIPAKSNASVFFVRDLKQAQKIEKDSAANKKKRVSQKPTSTRTKTQAVKEKSREEVKDAVQDFLNLPKEDADPRELTAADKKVKDFLKPIIGVQLTNKYYENIMNSVKNATDPIGWEIRLKVAVCDENASRKIYDALSSKFAELQTIVS